MITDDRTLRVPTLLNPAYLWPIAAAVRRWYAVQIARAEGSNPFEFTLLIACVLSGAAHVVGAGQPSLMDTALGRAWGIAWAVLLGASGGVALVGVIWRGNIATGLQLEWAGLMGLAGALLAVTATTATHAVLVGGIAGPICAALGLGSLWRIWHIRAGFRRAVRRVEHQARRADQ